MLDRDCFELGESIQGFKPLFTSVSAGFDAAKRQLDPATRTIVVDEDLSTAEVFGHPELAGTLAGPDAGDQAKGSGVGQFNGMGFIFEGHGTQHRPEDLVLIQAVRDGHVPQQGWGLVKAMLAGPTRKFSKACPNRAKSGS